MLVVSPKYSMCVRSIHPMRRALHCIKAPGAPLGPATKLFLVRAICKPYTVSVPKFTGYAATALVSQRFGANLSREHQRQAYKSLLGTHLEVPLLYVDSTQYVVPIGALSAAFQTYLSGLLLRRPLHHKDTLLDSHLSGPVVASPPIVDAIS